MTATAGVDHFWEHGRIEIPMGTQRALDEDSPGIREILYRSDGGECAACGCARRMRNREFDHITPCLKGGRHSDANLQLLSRWCIRTNGNRDVNYLGVRLRETGAA